MVMCQYKDESRLTFFLDVLDVLDMIDVIDVLDVLDVIDVIDVIDVVDWQVHRWPSTRRCASRTSTCN